MSNNREKIINTIAKLFELANPERNNSEGEILNALTRAKEMMAQYEVTEYELAQSSSDGANALPDWLFTEADLNIGQRNKLMYWENVLLSAVQNLTGTKAVIHKTVDPTSYLRNASRNSYSLRIAFYGDDVDCKIALHLFAYLSAAAVLNAAHLKGKTARNSYLVGFMTAVFHRSKEAVTSTKTDFSNQHALVSTEKKDWLDRNLKDRFENLTKTKAKATIGSEKDYASGYADGRNQSLRGDNLLEKGDRYALSS